MKRGLNANVQSCRALIALNVRSSSTDASIVRSSRIAPARWLVARVTESTLLC